MAGSNVDSIDTPRMTVVSRPPSAAGTARRYTSSKISPASATASAMNSSDSWPLLSGARPEAIQRSTYAVTMPQKASTYRATPSA